MFSKLIAALVSCAALCAQGCPDTTTRVVPTDIVVGPTIDCSSLQPKFDGVQIGGQVSGCPTVIVVVPAHAEPKSEPGCGTRVVPDGQVQITKLFFECEFSYFLFIKLGSSCVMKQRVNAGGLVTYRAEPCEAVVHSTLGA